MKRIASLLLIAAAAALPAAAEPAQQDYRIIFHPGEIGGDEHVQTARITYGAASAAGVVFAYAMRSVVGVVD